MKKEVIDIVIRDFYDLAKSDFLIGYHFRHIKNFDTHIPKIQRFWYLILLDLSSQEKKEVVTQGVPKNVINSHEYLKIKPGEVGRWIVLFEQILKKHHDRHPILINQWRTEIIKFQRLFLSSPTLFK